MSAVRTKWTENFRESTALLWSELKLPAGFSPLLFSGDICWCWEQAGDQTWFRKRSSAGTERSQWSFQWSWVWRRNRNSRGPSAQCRVEWVTDKLDYHLLRSPRELSCSLQGLGNKDPPQEGVCYSSPLESSKQVPGWSCLSWEARGGGWEPQSPADSQGWDVWDLLGS